MCGRYFRRCDKQRIAEAIHLGVFEDLPLEAAPFLQHRANYPGRNNRDTGERQMVAMRSGMVPPFVKSLADFKGFSTIRFRRLRQSAKRLTGIEIDWACNTTIRTPMSMFCGFSVSALEIWRQASCGGLLLYRRQYRSVETRRLSPVTTGPDKQTGVQHRYHSG